MHPLLLALAFTAPAIARLPATPAPAVHEVSGTVTDSAGAPIANVRLTLIELHRVTTTGTEGRFSFPAVDPGSYHLSIAAIGFAPVIQPVTVGDTDAVVRISLK